jgi:hypothetical protein
MACTLFSSFGLVERQIHLKANSMETYAALFILMRKEDRQLETHWQNYSSSQASAALIRTDSATHSQSSCLSQRADGACVDIA